MKISLVWLSISILIILSLLYTMYERILDSDLGLVVVCILAIPVIINLLLDEE